MNHSAAGQRCDVEARARRHRGGPADGDGGRRRGGARIHPRRRPLAEPAIEVGEWIRGGDRLPAVVGRPPEDVPSV